MKSNRYMKLVNVFVALGSFCYGYCASVISSTIGQPGWYIQFDLPQNGEPGYEGRTTNVIATANGLFSAGGAVGCIWMMIMGDYLGRKRNIQIGAFTTMFGAALQTGGATLAMFQAGRWICGMGIGTLVTVVPMYMSEMARPAARGWIVGHHAIFLVFGYMTSAWVSYGCYYATDVNMNFAWRFPLAIQCLPSLLLLIGGQFIPESPRWCVSQDKIEEGWNSLLKLRRDAEHDPDNTFIKEEFYQIREQILLDKTKLQQSGGGIWKAVLKRPSYRKRMFVGFLTQWGAEFGGPLVVNNYQVILYTNLGQTGGMPLLLAAVWLTTAAIWNPIGAWLHDKVNSRRKMYMTGFAGIVVTVSVEAALVAQFSSTDNKVGNGFAILFLFLYLLMQGMFCDTTMYIYVSEIFPTEIRAIGMGFSLFGQFASALILLQTAPIGFANVGWKYYLVIIIWSAFFIPVIYFYFPETAKLSLEEINAQFGDDVAVHINDVPYEQRKQLDEFIKSIDVIHLPEDEKANQDNVEDVEVNSKN
ncbi:hypothetical protein CANCADRAFT_26892 [Tortispora caseinolytica NRRL Y-17796]|uniref:Major facilitator superfamily (MFS) profile domain-containing protein n=1 Tax=Tortispora caseinolytica NRRL Y-17796 TaxID=767744 RepID=A0A1E4TCS8_9ASCO|nr:hypothetical protein CANCADRAFT_26892 [Tortispora caseinolytica NRRL Y-17796]